MNNETIYLHEKGPETRGGRSTRALSITRLFDVHDTRAIDLGSNAGYNSFDLYECGCREVLGIEVRDKYLELANAEKNRLGYDHVHFRKADAQHIDEFELGKFDLCLCTGLLYHMQNPFNLLKRIRNICRYVALETHISPAWLNWRKCGEKYRKHLTRRTHQVMLDGVPFRGRLNIFPASQEMQTTSGSIVSHATFWFTKQSLLKAFDLAGFHVRACYFGRPPQGFPDILIDHGVARTKIFIWAEVKEPDREIPVENSRITGCDRLLEP
ncbi:MAG: methyltransferase domain-containing protein [Lentisphaerae bacterium]|nr:methyltransferase domain-containing protein [Lentisphaerota bacterium]